MPFAEVIGSRLSRGKKAMMKLLIFNILLLPRLSNFEVIFLWDFSKLFLWHYAFYHHLKFLLQHKAEGMTEVEIWCIFLLILSS